MTPTHRAQVILKVHRDAAEVALKHNPELFDFAAAFRAEEKKARLFKSIAVELIRFQQTWGMDPVTVDERSFLRLIGCSGPYRKRLFSTNWEHVCEFLKMIRELRAKEVKK